MNQPNTSASDNQGDNDSSQKSTRRANRRRVLLVAIIALVLVATLVFVLVFMNRNDDRSSIDSMDMQSTNSNQPTPEAENSNPAQQPAATGTVITTGESEFGTILFNEKKQAIYIWELEDSSAECYGDCAEAWPPVLTDGDPQATGEVSSGLLGTTQRSDGNTQVTYNGHPLYYYAHEGPGEVKCHNVATHGGLWWVIQPNGNRAD